MAKRTYRRGGVMHMSVPSRVRGVDGAPVALPACLANGWRLTTDWRLVTCLRCLRKKPTETAP